MADDPDTFSLPGSPARSASELCDEAYADLLGALHEVSTGTRSGWTTRSG
jgi:hypothetical protein